MNYLTHISFGFVLIFAIIIILLCINYFKQKKIIRNHNAETEKQKEFYEKEIKFRNGEIIRLQYIINEYKKNTVSISPVSEKNNETIIINNSTAGADILAEVEKLELEKKRFQEKNKKLWEQSAAIHKEKEKIDTAKKEIETRHKQLKDSIAYAKKIQDALLPAQNQLAEYLPEYFIYWKPRDIVSGDFFWVKPFNNKLIIVVADCTGHGVPGAFMSALGVAFLNEIVSRKTNINSSEILEELRALIKISLKQDKNSDTKDGMDMGLCIIDKEAGMLSFSGANNPLFFYRNNEIKELEAVKSPVGIHIVERSFITINEQIHPTDVYYMFSDGYHDEFGGPSGKKFTKQRFKNLLLEVNQKQLSLNEQNEYLDQTMQYWLNDSYRQIDDMLVMGFKVGV